MTFMLWRFWWKLYSRKPNYVIMLCKKFWSRLSNLISHSSGRQPDRSGAILNWKVRSSCGCIMIERLEHRSKFAQAITHPSCIMEARNSNLSPDFSNVPEVSRFFSLSLDKYGTVPQIRPILLPSTFCPMYYQSVVLIRRLSYWQNR